MKRCLLIVFLLLASFGCIDDTEEPPQMNNTASFTLDDSQLSEQILMLTQENANLRQQISDMNLSLIHYQSELLAFQQIYLGRSGSNATSFYGTAMLDGPAVRQWIEQEGEYPFIVQRLVTEGQMLTISAEVVGGKGRVMVVTNPRMGTIFQDAANTAVVLAENRTGLSLTGSDVIFSVNGSEVTSVDGPSAGALMTAILIGALENRSFNESVTMTGTIAQDGSIGAIGGVVEKAQAAKDAGKTLFLLPKENSKLVKWEEVREQHGAFTYVTRTPIQLDAREYIKENVGITVKYVETIDEALENLLQG